MEKDSLFSLLLPEKCSISTRCDGPRSTATVAKIGKDSKDAAFPPSRDAFWPPLLSSDVLRHRLCIAPFVLKDRSNFPNPRQTLELFSSQLLEVYYPFFFNSGMIAESH